MGYGRIRYIGYYGYIRHNVLYILSLEEVREQRNVTDREIINIHRDINWKTRQVDIEQQGISQGSIHSAQCIVGLINCVKCTVAYAYCI